MRLMFRDKVIKPIFVFTLALIAIVTAFLFPYVVYGYENVKLNEYGIHYVVEPIKIKSNTFSLYDKLGNMPQIFYEGAYVNMDNNNPKLNQYDMKRTNGEIKEIVSELIMDVILNCDSLNITSEERASLKNALLDNDNVFISNVLIIETFSKEMYIAWDMYLVIEDIQFDIIIDDETGKMLSFYISSSGDTYVVKMIEDGMNSGALASRLSEYYGMPLIRVDSYNTDSTKISQNIVMSVDEEKTDDHTEKKLLLLPLSYSTDEYNFSQVYFNYDTYDMFYYDNTNIDNSITIEQTIPDEAPDSEIESSFEDDSE